MKKILMLIAFLGTYTMASSATSDISVSEKQICVDKIAKRDTIIIREVRLAREARSSEVNPSRTREISSEDRDNRVSRGERKNREITVEEEKNTHISRTRHSRHDNRLVRHSRHSRCLRIATRKSRIVRHTVLLASL